MLSQIWPTLPVPHTNARGAVVELYPAGSLLEIISMFCLAAPNIFP